ncbi:MAG: acyl carrier protein [Acidimicrobiia bacterium]|nr:acyl carrier protein [Acidimicrobiia bacterium]
MAHSADHRPSASDPPSALHRTRQPPSKGAPVDQELFARFKKCAVEVLSVSEDQIVPEARFGDDLDADSLDLVELVMALEEEFDISVPEEELEGIETVGQAYDLVAGKL